MSITDPDEYSTTTRPGKAGNQHQEIFNLEQLRSRWSRSSGEPAPVIAEVLPVAGERVQIRPTRRALFLRLKTMVREQWADQGEQLRVLETQMSVIEGLLDRTEDHEAGKNKEEGLALRAELALLEDLLEAALLDRSQG